MTVNEWLEKHHPLKPGEYYLSWKKLMKEYGKYCAEEAFSAGFREGKEYYPSTFSEFWSEFQKEETKCPIKADSWR